MKRIVLAMLMLPLAAGLAQAGRSEAEVRDEILRQGYTLFHAERFDELDRLADDYRINERRTPSGMWKLLKLHEAIFSEVSCLCVDESEYFAMEARAKRWIAQNPESTTAHIVYATALRWHGWLNRGGRRANKVEEEAWEPFRKYIEKARRHLEENKAQLVADPQWYAAMLRIATDQSWSGGDFDDLLDEGLARYPYYLGIWYDATRYLSPKWHGSERDQWVLAKRAVAITAEREGAGLYARIYWFAAEAEFGRGVIIQKPVVWDKMPAAMEDVLAQYPDQWNLINFARLTCAVGDRDTTARMVSRIDERLVAGAWYDDKPTYEQCRDWALGT